MSLSDNPLRYGVAVDEIPRGMHNVPLPPLSMMQDADLAGIKPGLEMVVYILGNMEAAHISEYQLDLISVQAGIYVGQNRGGELVWRHTILTEHPNMIKLPSDNEEEQMRLERHARRYAEGWRIRQNYRKLPEIIEVLTKAGVGRLVDIHPGDLDIVSGLFIAQNWDGVVLWRRTEREENPGPYPDYRRPRAD